MFVTLRDPVANDPGVQPDPPNAVVDPQTGQVTGYTASPNGAMASISNLFGGFSGGMLLPLLLLGGGALLVFSGDGGKRYRG
jgi:hypothetical protein